MKEKKQKKSDGPVITVLFENQSLVGTLGIDATLLKTNPQGGEISPGEVSDLMFGMTERIFLDTQEHEHVITPDILRLRHKVLQTIKPAGDFHESLGDE